MKYILPINVNGQTQPWWFNFLYSLSATTILNDLESEFAKWNAKIILDPSTQTGDTIEFETEKDMSWFVLRWS